MPTHSLDAGNIIAGDSRDTGGQEKNYRAGPPLQVKCHVVFTLLSATKHFVQPVHIVEAPLLSENGSSNPLNEGGYQKHEYHSLSLIGDNALYESEKEKIRTNINEYESYLLILAMDVHLKKGIRVSF
jgi:hypothetical protein